METLTGKTVVITGANTGIGKWAAQKIAAKGARVVIACRSKEKTEPVLAELKAATGNQEIEFLRLDLADLASVRAAANTLLDRGTAISVLINNAGLAGKKGLTKDGFELTVGTNHLGHFLWTKMLLPLVQKSEAARVVTVASKSHYQAKAIDWNRFTQPTKSFSGLSEYSVSKLCNVLFSNELARRAGSSLNTYSVHPGVVATDVWREVPGPARWLIKRFMLTAEQGAHSMVHTATSPELAKDTGRYYDADGREKRPSKLALDANLAMQLWHKSAEWVGIEP